MQTTVPRTKSSPNCAGKRHGALKNKQGAAASEQQSSTTSQEEYAAPLVDIIEYDNEFVIVADMPGVCEEGVDVNFNDGELTIFGAVEEADDQEDVVVRSYQFNPSDYFRSFRVGEFRTLEGANVRAESSAAAFAKNASIRGECAKRRRAVRLRSLPGG